jgi:hypothetical protein
VTSFVGPSQSSYRGALAVTAGHWSRGAERHQLGRLEQARTRSGIEAFTEVRDGLMFNAFVSHDRARR